MSIQAALVRGYIMKSAAYEDAVVIGKIDIPISAAIAAKYINEAAAEFIRTQVEGTAQAAPFTRHDIQTPVESRAVAPNETLLEALTQMFARPSAQTKAAAIAAIEALAVSQEDVA